MAQVKNLNLHTLQTATQELVRPTCNPKKAAMFQIVFLEMRDCSNRKIKAVFSIIDLVDYYDVSKRPIC